MGKVILVAAVTLDGYLANSAGNAKRWLNGDSYGIEKMKSSSHVLGTDTPLTMLPDWLNNSTPNSIYLIEAEPATTGIVNDLLRMRLVNMIIIYTIPVISGNGCRPFHSMLPESTLECYSVKRYKDGTVKTVYTCSGHKRHYKSSISLFGRVFGWRFPVRNPDTADDEVFPKEYEL